MQDKVFINCPYDSSYKFMFFALIYICSYYGFDPIFASNDESSTNRIDRIIQCIQESKYSIHDISKNDPISPRYNMPFELGMYYMHIYETAKDKKILVLEGMKNKSDKILSDLSGIEIKCHSDDLEKLFPPVRNFFYQMNTEVKISPKKMYREYVLDCVVKIDELAQANGFESYMELEPFEFKEYIKEYLKGKTGRFTENKEDIITKGIHA